MASSTPRPTPIRLVTFDLYDTLIEIHPPRWVRMAAACARHGLSADPIALRAADVVAEDYYTEENGRFPIRDRSPEDRDAFRLDHMARWLAAANLPHDPDTVAALRRSYLSEFEEEAGGGYRYPYRVFDDVLPALARVRAAGIKTAVISNADADVTALCTEHAFATEMDLIVTSALVGWEKPDPRTFRAALDPLDVDPAAALHVGDQPRSDVAGALSLGMRAALLDRYARHTPNAYGVPHVANLDHLADLVLGA